MMAANGSEATPSDVTNLHRRPKAKVSFTYLPAATKRENLETLLVPFLIENWNEEEDTFSKDGTKSSTLGILGSDDQHNGVYMMRELTRLWCRRNRTSTETPSSPGTSADHATPGWLEVKQYDGDSIRVKKTEAVQILTLKTISFGSFQDHSTFVNHTCIGQSTHTLQAKFEHDLRNLNIIFHQRNTDIVKKIEFGYRDVEVYVVFDVLLDGFRMFLPLLYPPKVYTSELDKVYEYVTNPQIMSEGTFWNRDISLVDPSCDADVLGRCSVVCLEYRSVARNHELTVDASPLWSLYTRLRRSDFSVYFSAIKGISQVHKVLKPDAKFLKDFETLYAIESLFSRGSKFLDRCSPELIEMISKAPSSLVAPAITEVAHVWLEDDRFCNLEEAFKTELETARYLSENPREEEELPPHFVNIRRVVVTPTRILFLRAETVVENRTVRDYGPDRFLRVAFRDEDYRKLMAPVPRFMTKITARIKIVLKHGIQIGGRHYKFLACSNSQLREHGCWFYAPDGKYRHRITSIRRWMGDLSEERCVATYVARMGQFFSSSKDTVTVSVEDETVQEIQDVERKYRTPSGKIAKYCFSDGVGTISHELAVEVSETLGLGRTPSAFQIRYAGCKGVLSAWPNRNKGENTKLMQIRPSMKKFESKHKSLEVMATTGPGQLFLNRQAITLLSQLGVHDDEFLQRQEKMLYRLPNMFLYEETALEALTRAQPHVRFAKLRGAGLHLTTEPHFRDILQAVYKSKLDDLLRRTRIEIDTSEGRIMMGIMDETGTLQYGQVFVQYSKKVNKPQKDGEILNGSVVVTKNPCFHPGDVRQFQAVDVEALHHCMDCIVFPSRGPRPHPNEISGSDLDGDMYFVTWAPGFTLSRNEDAMDYTSQPKRKLNREVDENDIHDFVANYISSDQLGLIANAHLANADFQKEGIFFESLLRTCRSSLHSG